MFRCSSAMQSVQVIDESRATKRLTERRAVRQERREAAKRLASMRPEERSEARSDEERIERRVEVEEALGDKVAGYEHPWRALKLDYKLSRGRAGREYTEEEDRFLACLVDDTGYGEWATATAEVRRAHQFRFDWFMKTRSEADLQRRTDDIIAIVEKENARRGGSHDDSDSDEDERPAGKARGRGGAKSAPQRARKRPADAAASKAKRRR